LTASYVLDATGVKTGVSEASAQFGKLEEDSSKLGGAVDESTSRLGNGFKSLGTTLGNFGIPFTGALTNMGTKLDEAKTKGNSFGQAMSTIGGTTLLVGAAGFAAVAGESVHLAQAFQSTVTSIAANAGIPVAAAQKIGQAFLGTAGSTIYSGQQIATAYAGVAGQLGATQGKALDSAQAMNVMKNAMDLAEGSGTDLNTATSALASTMQAYGAKANEAEKYTDLLYNTSRITGTGIDTVAASFQKLHSTLGAVTPDVGQLGGMLVELTEHGETGRKALSAINTTLNGMLAPTKAVENAQKLMGISVFDASGQFVGMGNLITQLQPKLAGMSEEQQLAALKAIGMGTANKALLTTILAGPDAFEKATQSASKMGNAHEAAEKQSQTLEHELATMKATVTDLATNFGEELIPKLDGALHVTEESVNWMEKHKTVAEALGIAIGTFLAGAVAVYTVNMVSGMIASTKSALTSIGLLSGATDEQTTKTGQLSAAVTEQSTSTDAGTASTDRLSAAVEQLTTVLTPAAEAGTEAATSADLVASSFDNAGSSATTAAAEIGSYDEAVSGAGAKSLTAAGEMDTLGASAEGAGAKMSIAGEAAGAEGMAGGMTAGGEAAAGLAGPLAAVAAAAAVVTLGAVALGNAISKGSTGFQDAANSAAGLADSTLPQMTLKMAALTAAQDKYSQSLNVGGTAGTIAKVAYEQLGEQIDILKGKHAQLTSNLQILNTNFGISKSQAESVANELGINLTQALTKPQVAAFSQQLSMMGIQADSSGTHVAGLSANTITAMTAMESSLKSVATSGDWSALGTSIDSGVANGITASQGVVVNAASGMVQAVITGARTGLKAASPSKVAADMIGATIPQGAAQGIMDNIHLPVAAANEMVKAITGVTVPSVPVASAAGAGVAAGPVGSVTAGLGVAASGTTINLSVIVQGNVSTERDLGDAIYQQLLQKGIVNGTSGQLVLAS
jgi:TP901 family phage tail tape measure protein